jgi:hypothetical protein
MLILHVNVKAFADMSPQFCSCPPSNLSPRGHHGAFRIPARSPFRCAELGYQRKGRIMGSDVVRARAGDDCIVFIILVTFDKIIRLVTMIFEISALSFFAIRGREREADSDRRHDELR